MCDPWRFALRRKSFPAERTYFNNHPRLHPDDLIFGHFVRKLNPDAFSIGVPCIPLACIAQHGRPDRANLEKSQRRPPVEHTSCRRVRFWKLSGPAPPASCRRTGGLATRRKPTACQHGPAGFTPVDRVFGSRRRKVSSDHRQGHDLVAAAKHGHHRREAGGGQCALLFGVLVSRPGLNRREVGGGQNAISV